MRTETVEYAGPDWSATFTVSDETILSTWRRARLRLDAQRAIEPDEDRRFIRIYSYPDVCAAVVQAKGFPRPWPPDFEQFLLLPGGLLEVLEGAIYRLNPQWLPEAATSADPKAEEPAPAPTSTNGSRSGRKRKTKTASSSPT